MAKCTNHYGEGYTEVCPNCGVNVYETPAERLQRLRARMDILQREAIVSEADALEAEIDRLEGSDRGPDW